MVTKLKADSKFGARKGKKDTPSKSGKGANGPKGKGGRGMMSIRRSTESEEKKKVAKPNPQPNAAKEGEEAEEEEVEIYEEDMSFFEEHGAFANFLSEDFADDIMKPPGSKKAKHEGQPKPKEVSHEETPVSGTSVKSGDKNDKAMAAERKPRRAAWGVDEVEESTRLPTKTRDGKLVLAGTEKGRTANVPSRLAKAMGLEEEAAGMEMDDGSADEDDEEVEDEEQDEEEAEEGDGSDNDAAAENESGEDEGEMEVVALQGGAVEGEGMDGETLVELRARLLQSKKVQMAVLCEAILEDPQAALQKEKNKDTRGPKRNKLQQLQAFSEDEDMTVRRLALLSLLSVFLDILPGYRIRLPSEKEQAVKVRKEVRALWVQEASMLQAYQHYLQLLERSARLADGLNKSAELLDQQQQQEQQLATSAVKAQCVLLIRHPHFNFRANLLGAVVPRANHRLASIRLEACGALKTLLSKDKSGSMGVEVVQLVSKLVKAKRFRVMPDIISCLANLQLNTSASSGAAARAALKRLRRKRKRQQEDDPAAAEVAQGMREAEGGAGGEEELQETKARQTETLQALLLLYFRVLKGAAERPDSPLLPVCLEGLAKYCHLINVEVVSDVMEVLRELSATPALPLPTAVRVVLCALHILQGPGELLKVDEKDFVTQLFRLLLPPDADAIEAAAVEAAEAAGDTRRSAAAVGAAAVAAAAAAGTVATYRQDGGAWRGGRLLQALQAALLRRKEYSCERAAAVAQRCLQAGLGEEEPAVLLAVLGFVKALLLRYPQLQALLESPSEKGGAGIFKPELDEPELCCALATEAWELTLLKKHYHPKVAAAATELSKMAAEVGGGGRGEGGGGGGGRRSTSFLSCLSEFDMRDGNLKPEPEVPRPHPLHQAIKRAQQMPKRKRRKLQRQQQLQQKQRAADDDEEEDEEEGEEGGKAGGSKGYVMLAGDKKLLPTLPLTASKFLSTAFVRTSEAASTAHGGVEEGGAKTAFGRKFRVERLEAEVDKLQTKCDLLGGLVAAWKRRRGAGEREGGEEEEEEEEEEEGDEEEN